MSSTDTITPRRVILRPLPKIVFLYPTWIVATFCAIVAGSWGTPLDLPETKAEAAAIVAPVEMTAAATPETPQGAAEQPAVETVKLVPRWAGGMFMIVFFLNMLIFAFDFPRTRSLLILFATVALLLTLNQFDALGPLGQLLSDVHPYANDHFFWSFSIFLLAIFASILIYTRFNYYEIAGNSILHHTGFLGKSKRYPTPNLRRSKEITDIFEFVLLGAGQYIFYPAQEREAIVLDVVPFIERKERAIQMLMSTIQIAEGSSGAMSDSDMF
ncbi:MAG: hypothetical protein H6834_11880 [Planctomycetes bacterium]|nr:hypothetical protein [Planctomycetota bacterium]